MIAAKGSYAMTEQQIQAEIARQIHEKFALLAARLRDAGQKHGPVVEKALVLVAEELERLDV